MKKKKKKKKVMQVYVKTRTSKNKIRNSIYVVYRKKGKTFISKGHIKKTNFWSMIGPERNLKNNSCKVCKYYTICDLKKITDETLTKLELENLFLSRMADMNLSSFETCNLIDSEETFIKEVNSSPKKDTGFGIVKAEYYEVEIEAKEEINPFFSYDNDLENLDPKGIKLLDKVPKFPDYYIIKQFDPKNQF